MRFCALNVMIAGFVWRIGSLSRKSGGRALCITMLLTFFLLSANAQTPSFELIKRNDGLPHRSIYSVNQAESGAILLGAANGLFEYDGLNFTEIPFASEGGSQHILGLQKMSDESFSFINSEKQIFKYGNDSIKEFLPRGLPAGFTPKVIFPYQDKASKLMIGDGKRVCIVSWKDQEVKACYEVASHIFAAGIDANGAVWLVQKDSISVFPPGKAVIKRKISKYTSTGLATRFYARPDGHFFLWVSTLGVLVDLAIVNDEIIDKVYFEVEGELRLFHLAEGNNGELLLGTNLGAWVITDSSQTNVLRSQSIYSVFQDRENNYWFASFPGMLFFMKTLHTRSYNAEQNGLPHNWIKQIVPIGEEGFAISTKDGYLGIYDGKDLSFTQAPANIYETEHFTEFENQWYWYDANLGQNLYRLNETGKLEKETLLFPYNLFQIAPYKSNYWLGYHNSNKLWLLAQEGDSVKSKKVILKEKKRVKLYKDKYRDAVWIGGFRCLYLYENDSLYDLSAQFPQGVYVQDFAQSTDSTIWILNQNDGLHGFQNKQRFRHIGKEEGLIASRFQVLEVFDDELWVGTNKGLWQINPKNEGITLYDYSDGLICDDITAILVRANEVWVGTTEGLSVVPIKEECRESVSVVRPKIRFKQLLINGSDTVLQKRYELAHFQNDLSIHFQTFAFRNAKSLQYRLIGIDTSWKQLATNINSVHFSNLGSGEYVFQVRAIDEYGTLSDSTPRLEFVILPPFWRQSWFRIAMVCLIIAVIFSAFGLYIKRLNQNAAIGQALLMAELTALKSQMNPHFLFNAMHSVKDFILASEPQAASEYVDQFAQLMRLVLEMSSRSKVYLQEEINLLEKYLFLEEIRLGGNCDFKIELGPEIEAEYFRLPPLLIQPFVENAVKHAFDANRSEKVLRISFSLLSWNELQCVVMDNGKGRRGARKCQTESHHTPLGTQLSEKRLALIGQDTLKAIHVNYEDLYSDLDEPIGTKVYLTIPIEVI